jgi:Domain of unknown function (DUF4347)
LSPRSFAERGLCPIDFTIDAEDDGLETITQLLAATGAKYLAIVAHGEPGVVYLGKNSQVGFHSSTQPTIYLSP